MINFTPQEIAELDREARTMEAQTTQPNPADFSVDEKPGEYRVRFDVRGEVTMDIDASSEAEARAKAEAMLEDEEFGLELDEARDVSIGYVRKRSPMYRVLREGKAMQVSRLEAGDLPREPDERGF